MRSGHAWARGPSNAARLFQAIRPTGIFAAVVPADTDPPPAAEHAGGDAAPRRTQAQRTATTRGAVLDAAVEALVARGYAGTSTRLVADRAGVSLGALQHHFPTKAALTVEAMRHLVQRITAEFVDAAPLGADDEDRLAELLDRLWLVFRGPSFAAGLELLVAARTDAALAEPMRAFDTEVERLLARSAAALLPDLARRDDFEGLMHLVFSCLRGLALLAQDDSATGSEHAARSWGLVRPHLLTAAAALRTSRPRPEDDRP